jgi:hypothetical protein
MPIFYVLLFLTGDTKGHMSWNVAEVAQSKAACEEIRKKKLREAVQKVSASMDLRSLRPAPLTLASNSAACSISSGSPAISVAICCRRSSDRPVPWGCGL